MVEVVTNKKDRGVELVSHNSSYGALPRAGRSRDDDH
jgi:hypothetical protein